MSLEEREQSSGEISAFQQEAAGSYHALLATFTNLSEHINKVVKPRTVSDVRPDGIVATTINEKSIPDENVSVISMEAFGRGQFIGAIFNHGAQQFTLSEMGRPDIKSGSVKATNIGTFSVNSEGKGAVGKNAWNQLPDQIKNFYTQATEPSPASFVNQLS